MFGPLPTCRRRRALTAASAAGLWFVFGALSARTRAPCGGPRGHPSVDPSRLVKTQCSFSSGSPSELRPWIGSFLKYDYSSVTRRSVRLGPLAHSGFEMRLWSYKHGATSGQPKKNGMRTGADAGKFSLEIPTWVSLPARVPATWSSSHRTEGAYRVLACVEHGGGLYPATTLVADIHQQAVYTPGVCSGWCLRAT